MIRSYFILAIRNIKRNKGYFLINIIGLSLGIASSLLAILFVLDELSFDKFQSKSERIYRLNKINTEPDGSTSNTGETSGLMGPTMLDEFPEVENIVRYLPWYDEVLLYRNDKNVYLDEGEFVFADSSLFDVFDFRLIEGNPQLALKRPSTLVITPELGQLLFGDENPVGKKIHGLGEHEYEITGIIEPSPRNSHIQFKAIASWATTVPNVGPLGYDFINNWIAQGITTYILVRENSNVGSLQEKFPVFMQQHMPTRVDRYQLYLQPFNELYLYSSGISSRMARIGNVEYLYIFGIVAVFILAIACINYINISTSKATRRAREVGMRKSLGASKLQLIQQFMGESFMVTILSGLMALLIADLALPSFNSLAGKSLEQSALLGFDVLTGLVILIAVVSIASGLYPAFILSTFRPTEVLKASSKSKITGHWPRQVLIIFQFAMSIIMIAGALIVNEQMNFVLKKDLGFKKEQVIVVPVTRDIINKKETFADEVRTHSAVKVVSMCRDVLGSGHSSTMIIPEGLTENVEVRMFRVDGNFDQTFGTEMAEGRFFDTRLTSDSNSFIVNEAFVRKSNWSNPLQKTIRFEGDSASYPIIGVVHDFNYSSLRSDVEPLIMWIDPRIGSMAVRFEGQGTRELLEYLEDLWKRFEPRYPFNYYFLDQQFASMYQSEEKIFDTIMIFAALSIFISSLGLYGLVSFTLEQRTKEIGIRKVLGATAAGITMMVNRKFMWLVLLASVVGLPLAYKLAAGWIDQFAYHITIGPVAFIWALIITMAVTLLAVCIQTLKSAMANPANALRQE